MDQSTQTETDLWDVISMKTGIDVPLQLQNILKALGYDNENLLSEFCESKSEVTFKKVETFMRTKVAILVEDSEKQAYFGIFKNKPELFELLEGHKALLQRLGNYFHSHFQEAFLTTSHDRNILSERAVSLATVTSQGENNIQSRLDESIKKYIETTFQASSCPKSFDFQSDGKEGYSAKVKCLYCVTSFTLKKQGIAAWQTNNYYRHMRNCNKKQNTSGFQNIMSSFKKQPLSQGVSNTSVGRNLFDPRSDPSKFVEVVLEVGDLCQQTFNSSESQSKTQKRNRKDSLLSQDETLSDEDGSPNAKKSTSSTEKGNHSDGMKTDQQTSLAGERSPTVKESLQYESEDEPLHKLIKNTTNRDQVPSDSDNDNESSSEQNNNQFIKQENFLP